MHTWVHAPASTHPEDVGGSGEKRRKDGEREGETEILELWLLNVSPGEKI